MFTTTSRRPLLGLIAAAAIAWPPPATAAPRTAADSTLVLRGGQEGTALRSLTVEGEDRIHIEYERPDLTLGLEPERAPGLDWGSAHDVLDRTLPDLSGPFLALSARGRSPYVAHPWLRQFSAGAVAVFRPEVRGVARWKLSVVNARGEAVAVFEGRGEPPRQIEWDGRSKTGAPVVPGRTYSSVFEAHDRAGNKRTFVGGGFAVSAYRLETPAGPWLVFAGSELLARGGGAPPPPAVLVEAATWLNASPRQGQPIRVSATARTAEGARALAAEVERILAPLLLGGTGRIRVASEVEPDAPEGGTVTIAAL